MWIWFSKYAVGTPISRASSTTRSASGRFRPRGFSQIEAAKLRAVAHGGCDRLQHLDTAEVRAEHGDHVDVRDHLADAVEHTDLAEPTVARGSSELMREASAT